MLFRIALSNIRRAGRDYLVYFLTLALAVTVFYAFNTISFQVDIAGVGSKNPGNGHAFRLYYFWPHHISRFCNGFSVGLCQQLHHEKA